MDMFTCHVSKLSVAVLRSARTNTDNFTFNRHMYRDVYTGAATIQYNYTKETQLVMAKDMQTIIMCATGSII